MMLAFPGEQEAAVLVYLCQPVVELLVGVFENRLPLLRHKALRDRHK
jgi:hypothetical protein